MGDSLQATWERYVMSWKAASAEEKRALYARCLAPRCVYTDPLTRAVGWDELSEYMLQFHRQLPGGHFVTQSFLAHHGKSISTWKMINGQGAVVGDGISYAEYDGQGKLLDITGFFDTRANGGGG